MTAADGYCLCSICVGAPKKNTCLAWVENHVGRKTIKGHTLFFWLLLQRSKTLHSPISDCVSADLLPSAVSSSPSLWSPWRHLCLVSLLTCMSLFWAPPSLINAGLSCQSYSGGCWCFGMGASVFWSNSVPGVNGCVSSSASYASRWNSWEALAQFSLFLCSTMEGYYDNTNITISQWVSPVSVDVRNIEEVKLSCVWYPAIRWPLVATFRTSRECQGHKQKLASAVWVHDGR